MIQVVVMVVLRDCGWMCECVVDAKVMNGSMYCRCRRQGMCKGVCE
jgi:hypothetical protein